MEKYVYGLDILVYYKHVSSPQIHLQILCNPIQNLIGFFKSDFSIPLNCLILNFLWEFKVPKQAMEILKKKKLHTYGTVF